MSFIQIKTHQYQGLEKKEILVQGVKTRGLAQLSLSGNISSTLRDSKDKIKAVVARCSAWGPVDKILIHLLPSDLPKFCPKLELPVALVIRALLTEDELTIEQRNRLAEYDFRGMVALSGELIEAQVVGKEGDQLGAFQHLEEVWNFVLTGEGVFPNAADEDCGQGLISSVAPETKGRAYEKFWLEVAARARVPVLLMGSPGIGKTHLAKWAHSLLAAPDKTVRSQVNRIWTLAGKAGIPHVPMQNPHARSHLSEFVGVNQREVPRPGIFSLAHGGLLVLDEFPELARDCREILRNILDEKEVRRNTKTGFISWPADFWLILTANPCPCGLAQGEDLSRCRCPENSRLKYISRFSGPLLDRIGIKLFLRNAEAPLPIENVCTGEDQTLRELPLPAEPLHARQRDTFARIWQAYLSIVGYSTANEDYFKAFIGDQLAFQQRWLGHAYY